MAHFIINQKIIILQCFYFEIFIGQCLDWYAVESEYGRKIDTYKDTILIDDQERDVNILRIGRLVLAYQTSDLSETGIYNKESQTWEPLPGRYRNSIRDGIAMAKKVKTVDILELPVPAAEVVQWNSDY